MIRTFGCPSRNQTSIPVSEIILDRPPRPPTTILSSDNGKIKEIIKKYYKCVIIQLSAWLISLKPSFPKEFSPIKLKLGEVDIKRKCYTEEQIIGILKERTAGLPANEVIRKHGNANGTFYRWKSKYGGIDVSEVKRLRGLEPGNAKLKKLLAETLLEKTARKVTPSVEILTEKR